MTNKTIKMQTNDKPSSEASDVSNEQILDLLKKQGDELQSLREKNQTLEDKLDPYKAIKDSRKKYEGPRAYSYGLIDGKPVISWETTLDTMFQNPYTKRWEAKQEITVTFIDGKTTLYDIVVWGNVFKASNKVIAKEVKQKGAKTFYVLEHNGEEFEIEQTFINP